MIEVANNIDYYSRSEVSNSDLSWLKQQLWPREMPDPTNAYRFGSLIDAMLTEPERVDYFNYLVGSVHYSKDDFELALRMKEAFYRDPVAYSLLSVSSGQVEMAKRADLCFSDISFNLPVRCKWDLWAKALHHGGDIKSTTATSQSEFEAAAEYFDYDRQRAWYMDIAGAEKDILIGISKKNQKVFKIFITKESEFYKRGREKYQELAFRWWLLFGEGRPEVC
ncbi:MAG: PD-(D/E)XK nuclease-like domain-containing protein [Bacteroidales bacterium]|nr:PD-(D/E)XK nuclease-like domain-containing protein [Bacteroidales bacterium]